MRSMLALLFAFLSGVAVAQKSKTPRFIAYADLHSQYGELLRLTRTSISDVLFTAASKNSVPLYRFDDFSKSPKPLSFPEAKKAMIIQFPEWQSTEAYESYHWVRFNGKNYKCKGEKIVDKQPDQYPDLWAAHPTQYYNFFSLNVVGFDYRTDKSRKPELQFLHFYIQELYGEQPRYVASIRADDAVKTLNETNILLSTPSPMNYLGGDMFFFNRDDNEKILLDFLNHVDTSRVDDRITQAIESYSIVNVLSRYSNGKVQKLLLSVQPTDNPTGEALADSTSVSEIRLGTGPRKKLLRLGNVLLDTGNLRLYDIVSYKALKDKPVTWSGNVPPVKKISTRVSERLTFRDGFYSDYYSDDIYKTLDECLALIFRGIEEQKIKVYHTSILDSAYSMALIKDRWTAVPPYQFPPWESTGDYYTGDKVDWKGKTYEAVKESANKPPDTSEEYWAPTSSGLVLYQPADVGFMEVNYSLLFDDTGTVIAKKPLALLIGIPGARTPVGFDHHLGYLSYAEVTAYLDTNSKKVSASIRSILEKQNGLFRIVEYGELLATD